MNKYTIKLKDQDELIIALADEVESETDDELVLFKVRVTLTGGAGMGVTPIVTSKERLLCGLFDNVEYFYIGEEINSGQNQ